MREDRTHLEIAVVGIGCRFPKADDAETFFGHLVEGRQLFSEVPRDRWDHRAFFSKSQRDTDKTWTPTGGFIDDVRSFAALHYGIPPRRLEVMDPQQRLLIETVREAIQDAGYEARGFDRARTGVFVGLSVNEYKNLNLARIGAMMLASGSFGPAAGSQALRDAILELTKNLAPTRAFSIAGNLTNMSAASVSQTFDFTGPSYTIDAACAAGATAIYDAVLHLRAGLVDVAMAGGAYVNLTPDNLVGFTRVGAISPSGVCRPFDARADGFVQGDGVAMLMLKRVGDALRDGDAIYGVLRGVGCNNDGRGEGPMTPRVEGQLDVLGKAYRDAAVSPATIAYFEAHGTGTRVGDPTEVEALGRLLTEAGVAQDDVRPLGSVKGNVGHTMSCAGVASLVKALKMVEHHVAPPLAGFETPHPELGFERWPVLPERAARPIDGIGGGPLRVGTSAFGFGGTNVHFVVEEAPPPMRRVGRRSAFAARAIAEGRDPRPADAPHAVVVSAPSLALLRSYATTLCASLDRPELRDLTLGRLAYTLNATRTLERFRAVLTVASREELVTRLETLAALPSPSGAWPLRLGPDLVVHDRGEGAPPAPKVAFMFAGQGAQKTGLLEDWTRRFPRFADALRRLSLAGQEAARSSSCCTPPRATPRPRPR
jgi:acyl transferase domain-containing protein